MRGFRTESNEIVDPDEYRSSRPTVNYSSHQYCANWPRRYDPPLQPVYPQPPYTASERQPWNPASSSYQAYQGTGPASPKEETETMSDQEEDVVIPMGPRPSGGAVDNPNKPFIFLGCQLDAFDLAQNVLDFSSYAYGPDSVTKRPVVEFVENLTKYGAVLRDLSDGKELRKYDEIISELPDASLQVLRHSIRADDYNARLQDLVAVCEEAMPARYRGSDGSIKRDACFSFTSTLLGRQRAMKDLAVDMRDWRISYGRRCAQGVDLMRDGKKKLDREEERRKRREEEAFRREEARRTEDARRREDTRRREDARRREDDRMLEERPHRREKHRHGKHRR